MTLLALLRHGATDWSAAKRIQGHTDTDLSEAGASALRAFRLPEAWAGVRAVSSPLRRCLRTAELLGVAHPVIEPRLREMHWGDWEGQSLAGLRLRLGDAMGVNEARGFDFRPEGGESPREVLARVRPWLAEVADAGDPVLALSHRGVMRVVFAWATGWDMLGKPPAKLDWSALQVFRLDAQGVPTVHALNQALPVRTAPASRSPGDEARR